MSTGQDTADQPDMGGGHSAATDPRGVALAGEQPDNWHPTGRPGARSTSEMTPEEKDYHRRVFGVTYRERYGHQAGVCVTYCLTPGQRRRGIRCPSCFQGVEIRPMEGSDVEPGLTRAERFAAWAGGWAGAFIEALLFPFRVGRAHTEAMVRDILREALEAGFQVDALTDILATLGSIEGELRAIRNAAEASGERAQ
jgi:hypothetical protein